ncbi:MAG: hypothetical protein L0Y57_06055 [Beijerinckiaceae bacterium]|nr:hypothetical protein [Beijerinckiaceae bacterium]MCI0600284.1 hypothetical protein [Beijerinckiaceae bacterium]MCI0735936.1 hypothetical protein [Beijerinckiaceae bacterium]
MRSIAGSLALAGARKWSVDELVAARDACDRSRCCVIAPSDGLYLSGVDYSYGDDNSVTAPAGVQQSLLAGTRAR